MDKNFTGIIGPIETSFQQKINLVMSKPNLGEQSTGCFLQGELVKQHN